jgi:pimeloyl-ACP methyl ester carboxylesterase
MSRRYFDLPVPAGVPGWSMARHLAAHGFVVVTLDPPGVGESDRPDDGYALTPEVVADVHAHAFEQILSKPLVPAGLTAIGVGHSAGAALVVYQQARHRSFVGLALLGFGAGGLPGHLRDDERRYAGDPEGLRPALAGLAAERFGEPLPVGSTGGSAFLVHGTVPDVARHALADASAAMLALVGLSCMIPGSCTAELAAIDVPVFLGSGDHDISGDPEDVARALSAVPQITSVVLGGSGHNHNVAPDRALLWDRLGDWAGDLV